MNFYERFALLSVATAIVLYVANLFFGKSFEFGNAVLGPVQALLYSSVLVSLVSSLVSQVEKEMKVSKEMRFVIYWVVNTLTLWVLARTYLSGPVGIGVSAFWISVVVGFVLGLVQYGVLDAISGSRRKKKRR